MFPEQYPETKSLYPTGSMNVSLLWRIPIGRITHKGELKQFDSRLTLHQTKIRQVKAQVNEEIIGAQAQLSISRQQMEISREASAWAEEALSQSIQRQKLGTVLPFEVLQAQEIYIKSTLDYLKAVADHNKQQYNLFVAMGNNL